MEARSGVTHLDYGTKKRRFESCRFYLLLYALLRVHPRIWRGRALWGVHAGGTG